MTDALENVSDLMEEVEATLGALGQGDECMTRYDPGEMLTDDLERLYRALLVLGDADKEAFLATLRPDDGSFYCPKGCGGRMVREHADAHAPADFVPCPASPGLSRFSTCPYFRKKGTGEAQDWRLAK